MNYGIRPLTAFSMSDYESLTRDNTVNFGRGKDKQKRKKRGAGFYAAAGGAGLAGAGVLGAAARYGGAALKTKNNADNFYKSATEGGRATVLPNRSIVARDMGGGARGQLNRDIESVKSLGSKVKNYDYKGAPGRMMDSVKSASGKPSESAKRAGNAVIGKTGQGNIFKEGASRVGNVWKSGKVGKAGLVGAGLAGAAAIGGAGYGAYKMTKRNKKKK